MTTREVTKREDGAGALARLPDGYMESFPEGYDESDHVLPFVSIIQPNSSAEKKALGKEGQYVSKDGTAYEMLRFVLVSCQYTRGLPNEFEGHNTDRPMWKCFSSNRRLGYPNIDIEELFGDEEPEYQYDPAGTAVVECVKCPHFADEKNWIKKGCRYSYTLRAWDLEAQRPFAFFVKGTGIGPIKAAVIDRVTPRIAGRDAQGNPKIISPERPFWWAEIEMTTRIREDKGSYYVPVVRVARDLTEAEMQPFAEMHGVVREAPLDIQEQAAFAIDED